MALKDRNTAAKADLGIDVEIFDPAGETTNITFHVLGSDSQVYLYAERAVHKRQLELGKRSKDFAVGLDYDQQQAANVEKMTACVTSWKEKKDDGTFKATITLEEGVELECTPDNVKKILKDRGFFFIRNQVQTAMDNPKNFLPSLPKPSSAPLSSGSATTVPTKTE
jgi:hypothetical protein